MSEVYRLAELKDAEQLLDVTYRAYQLIRELGLHWPAANADLALIEDNITANECYVLEVDGAVVATITLSKEEEIRKFSPLPFVKWFATTNWKFFEAYLAAALIFWGLTFLIERATSVIERRINLYNRGGVA